MRFKIENTYIRWKILIPAWCRSAQTRSSLLGPSKPPQVRRKSAWVLRHVDPIILRKYGVEKWERQRNRWSMRRGKTPKGRKVDGKGWEDVGGQLAAWVHGSCGHRVPSSRLGCFLGPCSGPQLPLRPYCSGWPLPSPGTMVTTRPRLLPRTTSASEVLPQLRSMLAPLSPRYHQRPHEVRGLGYILWPC